MSREELNKRYYHLPNEIMQLGLSVGEIAVYNYLKYCEDRKTYQCYPSYRKIGEALSISKKTVYKYVKSLEEKQLISTEPTTVTLKSGKKQNGNLLYTITPIQDATDFYYEKQMYELEKKLREQEALEKLRKFEQKHPEMNELEWLI